MDERLQRLEEKLKEVEGLVGLTRIEQVKLLKLFTLLFIGVDTLHPGWKPSKEYLDKLAAFTGLHPLNVQECLEMFAGLRQSLEGASEKGSKNQN